MHTPFCFTYRHIMHSPGGKGPIAHATPALHIHRSSRPQDKQPAMRPPQHPVTIAVATPPRHALHTRHFLSNLLSFSLHHKPLSRSRHPGNTPTSTPASSQASHQTSLFRAKHQQNTCTRSEEHAVAFPYASTPHTVHSSGRMATSRTASASVAPSLPPGTSTACLSTTLRVPGAPQACVPAGPP